MRQEPCEFEASLGYIVRLNLWWEGGREEVKKEGREEGRGKRKEGGRSGKKKGRGRKETVSNREDFVDDPFKTVLNVEGKKVRN